MITKDEFKMRITNYVEHLIDMYFSGGGAVSKFAGSTAKYALNRKMYAIDGMLDLFTDSEGMIDEDDIIEFMCDDLIGNEGVKVDARSLVKNELVASMLPSRIIVLTKKDIYDLFGK